MATAPSQELDNAPAQTRPAFLRRVQIRGYKSIAFCDVTLEPLTILVGRNASGKSNFLDALAFLRDVLAKGTVEAVNLHRGRNAILSPQVEGNTTSISIETDYENPITRTPFRAEYEISVELPDRNKPVVACESARILNRTEGSTVGFDREGERVEWVGFDDRPPPLDWCPSDRLMLGMYGNTPFLELNLALHELGIYSFSPEAIRELQRPTRGIQLEKTGRNLASVIASIQEEDPSVIRRITAYLAAIVRDVEHFEVVRYGEYETIRFRLRAVGGSQPVEFDAASMSDGTLRVLSALVAASQVQLPGGNGIIGIEEPETSLHPAAMRALVDALDEATLRTQVLLTTHSAEMLDNSTIKPENVRVVRMVDGQTTIGPVDEVHFEIVAQKLNSLGGLERENRLVPDLDDQDRQRALDQELRETRP